MEEYWSKYEPTSEAILDIPSGSGLIVRLNTTVGSTSTYSGLTLSLTDDCYHNVFFDGNSGGCQALAIGIGGDLSGVTDIELQSVDGAYTQTQINSYDSQNYNSDNSHWGLRFIVSDNPSVKSSILFVVGRPNNIHEGWHKLIFHEGSTSWYTLILLSG